MKFRKDHSLSLIAASISILLCFLCLLLGLIGRFASGIIYQYHAITISEELADYLLSVDYFNLYQLGNSLELSSWWFVTGIYNDPREFTSKYWGIGGAVFSCGVSFLVWVAVRQIEKWIFKKT